jgi:cyanophycinase
MSGTLALVGSGEFTSAMQRVDVELLASTGRSRPRVAILPTASIPDGEQVFLGWAEMGHQYFADLGAEVEAVLVRDRKDADDPIWAQAVGEADVVYLSGGKPTFLLAALAGSAVGVAIFEAFERGAVVAGSSAGAMALGGKTFRMRRRLPFPFGWQPALGLAPGVVVIPHYDAIPEAVLAPMALRAPRGSAVVGIDEDTALVGRAGAWQVLGAGRVTLWHGRHRARYREGDVVSL